MTSATWVVCKGSAGTCACMLSVPLDSNAQLLTSVVSLVTAAGGLQGQVSLNWVRAKNTIQKEASSSPSRDLSSAMDVILDFSSTPNQGTLSHRPALPGGDQGALLRSTLSCLGIQ